MYPYINLNETTFVFVVYTYGKDCQAFMEKGHITKDRTPLHVSVNYSKNNQAKTTTKFPDEVVVGLFIDIDARFTITHTLNAKDV